MVIHISPWITFFMTMIMDIYHDNYWLVVWNMTFSLPFIGMSSSQLTFIFFRRVDTITIITG